MKVKFLKVTTHRLYLVTEESSEAETRESLDDGTLSEVSNDAEVDTIIGRIYNYDYAVKLLTLSKWTETTYIKYLETVINPNTPDE